jgi:hypothetical protein
MCSSDQAIHPPPAHVLIPTVYSEEDWNEYSPDVVKEHGDETDLVNLYAASKAMADKGTPLLLSLRMNTHRSHSHVEVS